MIPVVVSCAALGLALLPTLAGAADLGTLGPTYGIAEPHLLNFIEQRLRDKERSGELQRLMQEAQSRGIDAVKRPQPVAGLRATEGPRTFYVDPTFTLDRNVVDAQGRLLFAAGTRKNPDGGTLAVLLGIKALQDGYRANLYPLGLRVMDPTWRELKRSALRDKLVQRASAMPTSVLRDEHLAYVEFLDLGGGVHIHELSPDLILGILEREADLGDEVGRLGHGQGAATLESIGEAAPGRELHHNERRRVVGAVSYTHLTLPTSDLV